MIDIKTVKTNLPNNQRRVVFLDDSDGFYRQKNRRNFFSFLNPYVAGGKFVYDKFFSLNRPNYINGDFDFFCNNYDFPPQHPIKGVIYACHDFHPNFYVPISNFHEKSLELKINDFFDLCESLGAKSCTILYEEVDNKVIQSNLDIKEIPTTKGNFSSNNSFNSDNKKATTFDAVINFTKPTQIRRIESLWLKSEISWKRMQDSRLGGGRGNTRIEFNYNDSFGIDGNLASSLNNLGFNLGGVYSEMKKVKYIYDVEFWEI